MGSLLKSAIQRTPVAFYSMSLQHVAMTHLCRSLSMMLVCLTITCYVPISRPLAPVMSVVLRSLHHLSIDELKEAHTESRLCQRDHLADFNADQLVLNTSSSVLDRLISAKSVTIRRHPSGPWFDGECRQFKRQVRRLERSSRRHSRVVLQTPRVFRRRPGPPNMVGARRYAGSVCISLIRKRTMFVYYSSLFLIFRLPKTS